MAGLGHDGAFGHDGGGGRGSQAGAQGVAGVVAGDARFGDQLFDHQGYELGGQAGRVDTSVPVHGAEERAFGDLEDLLGSPRKKTSAPVMRIRWKATFGLWDSR